ncbi:glycosyltransferase, partial [bacterium]|nr:glycosyltransferase [bacterium]
MNEQRSEPTSLTVAVITTSFPRYSGDEASLFLKRSVDAIQKTGVQTHIYVPYDRTEQEYESLGAHGSIHRVRYGIFRRGQLAFGQGILPNLRRNRWLALQIIPLLFQLFAAPFRHRKEWNLLHGHWVVTALPLFFLHLLTGKPYLITIRGEDVKLLRTPLRALFGILLSKAGAITTVSHDFEEELKGYYPGLSEKVQCIPNGVTRFEHEQSTPDTQELIFSYVGRVVPLKQPEVLIEIISELSQQSDLTPHLFLAGRVTDEYRTELQEKAHALGIGSQLHLTGSLSPAEIGALYHRSTLYLSASQHEGRSNSVLEA